MDSALSSLQCLQETLEERLYPIITPQTQLPDEKGSEEIPLVPLASVLAKKISKISSMRTFIEELLDRIKL